MVEVPGYEPATSAIPPQALNQTCHECNRLAEGIAGSCLGWNMFSLSDMKNERRPPQLLFATIAAAKEKTMNRTVNRLRGGSLQSSTATILLAYLAGCSAGPSTDIAASHLH